ncbi:MAG: AbrB/MazE/SpoVT family DNA-binding domain-containing protein [Candidatus Omnitrophica bacterium]|nr:AbrB/MazE/SpoVT family DNA-binding domain-containing protein [Candidatus Omnitrophota bacterium]
MMAIFQGKAYGAVSVGAKGQIVIPSELRRELNIKTGEHLMIFAKTDKNLISMMHVRDFSALMSKAGKLISSLEAQVPKTRAKKR